jgi:hypothetical protein
VSENPDHLKSYAEDSSLDFGLFRATRFWIAFLVLLALPAAIYWPNLWERFGVRDDYSMFREANTERGKVSVFSGGQARPVYGWLIEASMRSVHSIAGFARLRLWSALWVGLAAAGTMVCLTVFFGWSVCGATLLATLLVCLPSAQITLHWAIVWPHTMALAITVGAFFLANLAFERLTGWTGWGGVVGAGALLAVAAWTYQPHTLFYLVFVAAGLLSRRERPAQDRLKWTGRHALLVSAALAVAFLVIQAAYATGAMVKGPRIAFEAHPFDKLIWFLREPFLNGLALFVLDDDHERTAFWHGIAAAIVTGVILIGPILDGAKRGWRAACEWLFLFVAFATAAYGINLLVAERWPTYRTIFALAAVVLLFACQSLHELSAKWRLRRTGLTAFTAAAVVAAFVARRQARELIVEPQRRELALVEEKARALDLSRPQHFYVIFPDGEATGVRLTYLDEFGARSVDSYWAPVEMIRGLLQEWSGGRLNFGLAYGFDSSPEAPKKERFDVLIDLRAEKRK